MRRSYAIRHWRHSNKPHPEAYPDNQDWRIDLTSDEIVALADSHDVMIRRRQKEEVVVYLDDQGGFFTIR